LKENWTLLYEYSKDLFDMEVDRFKRLDDKANNQLRFTYVLLTIYIALMKIMVIDNIHTINNIIYIIIFCSFIFLFFAWLFYFLSLRLTTVPKLPLTDDVFILFKEKELMTVQYALYESIKKAIIQYDKIILKKAKNLRYGYNSTIISVILVIITAGYISYNNLDINPTSKKEVQMSEKKSEKENNNQNDSTTPSKSQPEFDVKIPDIQYATEGYEIDTTKYQELLEESERNKTK